MPIEVNKAAPAIWAAESAISEPIGTVWQVLSYFEGWPSWNKSVSKIKLDGPRRAGTLFVWVADGSKIVSRIEALMRRMAEQRRQEFIARGLLDH